MPEDATVRGSLYSMDQPLMNRCWTRPDALNGTVPCETDSDLVRNQPDVALFGRASVQLQAHATIYASTTYASTTAARSEGKPNAILDCHGGKVPSLGVLLG